MIGAPGSLTGYMLSAKPFEIVFVGLLAVALALLIAPDLRRFVRARNDPPAGALNLISDGDLPMGTADYCFSPWAVLRAEGIDHLEGEPGKRYRHALGPAVRLAVDPKEPVTIRLHFDLILLPACAPLTVRAEHEVLDTITGSEELITRDYFLSLHPGSNVILLEFAAYNHHGATVAEVDARPLAATFHQLWAHPE